MHRFSAGRGHGLRPPIAPHDRRQRAWAARHDAPHVRRAGRPRQDGGAAAAPEGRSIPLQRPGLVFDGIFILFSFRFPFLFLRCFFSVLVVSCLVLVHSLILRVFVAAWPWGRPFSFGLVFYCLYYFSVFNPLEAGKIGVVVVCHLEGRRQSSSCLASALRLP